MLSLWVVVMALASTDAAPAPAAAAPASTLVAKTHRPRLLVMDFRNDGVDARTVLIIRDALTAHLSKNPAIDVLSTEDLRRSLDVEAQKAAVGCNIEACMAEIASALGADYIVFGNIGPLGSLLVGNMSLLDAQKSTSMGRESIEVRSLEDLPAAVRTAGGRLVQSIGGAPPPSTGALSSPFLYAGIGALVVGVGALIVGGYESASSYGVITDEVSHASAKDDAVNTFNIFSAVAIGGAVVAIAGGGATAFAFVE